MISTVISKFWPEDTGLSGFSLLRSPAEKKPSHCCISPGFLLPLGRHVYGTLWFLTKSWIVFCFCVEEWAVSGLRNDSFLRTEVASRESTIPDPVFPYRRFVSITNLTFIIISWWMLWQEARHCHDLCSNREFSLTSGSIHVDLGQVLWWDLCLKLNKPFSILITGHSELFMDSVVQPCCCGLGLEVLHRDCWQEIYCKILRWSVHKSISSAHTLELNWLHLV